jgi:hypothetical protein
MGWYFSGGSIMNQSNLGKLLAAALAIVLAVGALDALIGRYWDLLALFVVALGIHGWAVARSQLGGPSVRLRRDLASWLRQRSQVTGEAIPVVADRAVAHYRSQYGSYDPRPEQ